MGHTVSLDRPTVEPEGSVPVVVPATGPLPAAVSVRRADVLPEAILQAICHAQKPRAGLPSDPDQSPGIARVELGPAIQGQDHIALELGQALRVHIDRMSYPGQDVRLS